MNYTITIDDALVVGLNDVLAQANAMNIQQRQSPFLDMTDFLTKSVIATANQGLNNVAQHKATVVAQMLSDGKSLAEITAAVG